MSRRAPNPAPEPPQAPSNPNRPTTPGGPGRQVSRRGVLRSAAGLGLGLVAATSTAACGLLGQRGALITVGAVTFANPLRIPPLDEGMIEAGVRTFDLTLQVGSTALVPQGATPTWGVNGTILGPTVRVHRGERVRLAVNNTLPEATTLHWHGMRLPARADGGPHQMIEPGATWEPTWTVDQPAATLWYHPHPHGQTELHLMRGIGGLLLVDDVETVAAQLPREYGVDDIPVILQDRTFDDAGAFVETERIDVGMLGDTMLVNGTVGPYFDVTATLTRLRVLNASAARTYTLCLSDNRPFTLIATDGGLVPAPVPLTRLMLSPGERADIVVEMSAGETLTLRSTAQDLGVSARLAERMGGADELDLLELRAAASLRDSPALPAALGDTGGLDARVPASQRTFDLGDNRINNQTMDMNRIDLRVVADTVEVWSVVNNHTRPHNFHVHDVQFLVLDRDGKLPPPELAGWKDTIYTPPGVTLRLAMRFGPNADAEVPYMFHCHLLWHEDQGMMGQFLVVEGAEQANPGAGAGAGAAANTNPPGTPAHHHGAA